jgi:peptidyl-prolyl cis-trans isomerase C
VGLYRDPDLIARVIDYRETLLVDRFVSARKGAATVVTNEEVQKYYDDNNDKYDEPARLGLALIQTATSESAAMALSDLRAGISFTDAASSYSDHLESKAKAGVVGLVSENSPSIPGIGENSEVVASLFKMNPNDVSGITEIGGRFYIFKVMTKYQARHVTVDEVRGQIESLLKRRREEAAASSIVHDLVKRYNARLLPDAAASVRRYVAQKSSSQTVDAASTATAGTPEPR